MDEVEECESHKQEARTRRQDLRKLGCAPHHTAYQDRTVIIGGQKLRATNIPDDDLENCPATHANRIRESRAKIARYRSMIARERHVGTVSGFVDKRNLYMAGQLIVAEEEKIRSEYEAYRLTGGKKPLSSL